MQLDDEVPLMPVRRLHNYAYCPRLFYLQWVENLFEENADTAEGSHFHRNVDQASPLKECLAEEERSKLRAVHLSSVALGITGVVDLLEDHEDGRALVDYKKGAPAPGPNGEMLAKQNDALQIAAYALLLGEEGVQIVSAWIYYGAVKRRIPVELNEALFNECRGMISSARALAAGLTCPPPLQTDNRCLHCSAYPICLPGESAFWAANSGAAPPKDLSPPRPENLEGEMLVVQNPRAHVGKKDNRLYVEVEGRTVKEVPLAQARTITLYGGVQISTAAMHACLENQVDVAWFSPSGRFLGRLEGLSASGVDARRGQYRLFDNMTVRVSLVREILRAKIHNQRVLLMRNGAAAENAVERLADLRNATGTAGDLDSLRGIEGAAAAAYFASFGGMLQPAESDAFNFDGRNRRPPRDPVNALLSLAYGALVKEMTGILQMIGLDPHLGFLHAPRYGRPALALDMMEEFRPLIADSVVISLLNRRELTPSDFVRTTRGVWLKDSGHRQFWPAWSRRMETEVSHPEFGYRMSYRRMLEVQCRQLWRFCRGEASAYHGFTTR